MMAEPSIRSYRESDRADVFDVCIRTGDGGQDATGQHGRDDILPDVYAAPYLRFDPSLAFVVDTGERVAGYILATDDTQEFVRRVRQEWLAGFIDRHESESGDDVFAAGIRPERMLVPGLADYPAHLHIDLLPELQRRGFGRMLVDTLLDALRSRDVPGVHLGTDDANTSAIAFYHRLGFRPLPAPDETGVLLGLRLVDEGVSRSRGSRETSAG